MDTIHQKHGKFIGLVNVITLFPSVFLLSPCSVDRASVTLPLCKLP